MNNQFSIGFVIALVVGVAIGALWPKYGSSLAEAANGRGQDVQQVSLVQPTGAQHGDCSGGGCKDSPDGIASQCSGNKKSGRGQGRGGKSGRGQGGGCDSGNASEGQCAGNHESGGGQSGRGQGRGRNGGRGQGGGCDSGNASEGQCAGNHDSGGGKSGRGQGRGRNGGSGQGGGCDSGNASEGQCAGNHESGGGQSGRGQGRRGASTCASEDGNGHCEQQTVSTQSCTGETCQESTGGSTAKGKCSDSAGHECENDLAVSRRSRNGSGKAQRAGAAKSKSQGPDKEQRGRGHDDPPFAGPHRGFGPGLGLALGPGGGHGWAKNFDQDDASADDESQGHAKRPKD